MSETSLPIRPTDVDVRAGFIAGVIAYSFWGFLPLYLQLIEFADVREVLGLRILWSIPAALIALVVMSGWRRGFADLATAFKPRMLATLAASAVMILCNWGLYVYLVMHQRVMEASLAYFLTPLVAVGVGVAFFKENISRWQASALGLAGFGVLVQTIALGAVPWLALAVCASWSAYALIRKGAPVSAPTGMFIETMVLAPIAIGFIVWAAQSGPLAFTQSTGHAVLLALSGPATALPLMLFAFSARRVSLTTLGLLQYLAPSIQFAIGFFSGEPFTPARAASFALIWLGLAVFSWDTLRRAAKRSAPSPTAVAAQNPQT